MAIKYVWSGAVGAGTGADWTNAYTTLQAALTAWTTADEIYVADDHNETFSANSTLTCGAATRASPCIVRSVNRTSGNYSPKAGTYQIQDTGWYTLDIDFSFRFYGLSIQASRGLRVDLASVHSKFYDCYLYSNTTVTSNCALTFGSASIAGNLVELFNTDFVSVNRAYIFLQGGTVKWHSGTISLADTNGGLGIFAVFTTQVVAKIKGVDLSACTSGDNVVHVNTGATQPFTVELDHCLLPSGVTIASSIPNPNQNISVFSSDTAGRTERSEDHWGAGSVVTSNSVYVDASSSEYASGSKFSLELIPTSSISASNPLRADGIVGVFESTGSKTVTLEVAHDFTSALQDDELYFDIFYPATASQTDLPIESSFTDGNGGIRDMVATPANLTTSTESWTGASGLTKQKMTKTVTAGRTGPFYIQVYLTKYEASKSAYVTSTVAIA